VSVAEAAELLGVTRQAVLKRSGPGLAATRWAGTTSCRVRASGWGLQDDPVLTEIVRRLVQAYEPERVYLFGSAARGESGPDSDYDVLLVVPDDAPPDRVRARLAYEVLWGVGAAVDVLVWRRSAFDAAPRCPPRSRRGAPGGHPAACRLTPVRRR
jgi:predicted nucleotidyltransferase